MRELSKQNANYQETSLMKGALFFEEICIKVKRKVLVSRLLARKLIKRTN